MHLNDDQKKLLQWIGAKQPVLGMFHNLENLEPMIRGGLIDKQPVPRSKGRLTLTEAGRAALDVVH